MHMARPLSDDDLWALLKPLLPPKPRCSRFPGRNPLAPREVLTGILFVLKTGIPWEALPQELGWGSGMTWAVSARLAPSRRLAAAPRGTPGRAARGAGTPDWSRAVVDSAPVRAVLGGPNGPESDGSTETVYWRADERRYSTVAPDILLRR